MHRLEVNLAVLRAHREVEVLEEVHAEKAINAVLVAKCQRLDDEAREVGAERVEAAELEQLSVLDPRGVGTRARMIASRDS